MYLSPAVYVITNRWKGNIGETGEVRDCIDKGGKETTSKIQNLYVMKTKTKDEDSHRGMQVAVERRNWIIVK